MKKTLILALCLMLALCATAFAVTEYNVSGENTKTLSDDSFADLAVYATYTVDDEAIYNIDIAYGTFAATYTAEWNGETHRYDLGAELTIENSTVTVVNHANRNITATVAFTDTANDGVTFAYDWSKAVTNEAVDVDAETAKTATVLEAANLTAYGNIDGAAKVTYTLAITADSVAIDNTVDPREWTGSNVTGGYKIGFVTLTLADSVAADVNPDNN